MFFTQILAKKHCLTTYLLVCTSRNKGGYLHHKPKTIFFTLKSYTYWKPIEKGLCEKVPFLFFITLRLLCGFAGTESFSLFCVPIQQHGHEKIRHHCSGRNRGRFGSTLPKQFVSLKDEPILMHTIRAFHHYDKGISIIVALPTEYISLWHDLCQTHSFAIRHKIAEGGQSRFESVKNALRFIEEPDSLVAVHDGAR